MRCTWVASHPSCVTRPRAHSWDAGAPPTLPLLVPLKVTSCLTFRKHGSNRVELPVLAVSYRCTVVTRPSPGIGPGISPGDGPTFFRRVSALSCSSLDGGEQLGEGLLCPGVRFYRKREQRCSWLGVGFCDRSGRTDGRTRQRLVKESREERENRLPLLLGGFHRDQRGAGLLPRRGKTIPSGMKANANTSLWGLKISGTKLALAATWLSPLLTSFVWLISARMRLAFGGLGVWREAKRGFWRGSVHAWDLSVSRRNVGVLTGAACGSWFSVVPSTIGTPP